MYIRMVRWDTDLSGDELSRTKLKQVKITLVVSAFFDQQKGSATSNHNNWATYDANKEKD